MDWPLSWYQILGTYLVGILAADLALIWYWSRWGQGHDYHVWVEDWFCRWLVALTWPYFLVITPVWWLARRTLTVVLANTLGRVERLVDGKAEQGPPSPS